MIIQWLRARARQDSNLRPLASEANTLSSELLAHPLVKDTLYQKKALLDRVKPKKKEISLKLGLEIGNLEKATFYTKINL